MREKFGNAFLLTDQQKEWVSMRKKINKLGPYIKSALMDKPPTNPLRRKLHDIVGHKYFEWGIMGCIVVNTVVMAATWLGQPRAWEAACVVINYFFAALFTVECVLKIIGLNTGLLVLSELKRVLLVLSLVLGRTSVEDARNLYERGRCDD